MQTSGGILVLSRKKNISLRLIEQLMIEKENLKLNNFFFLSTLPTAICARIRFHIPDGRSKL